MIVKQIWTANAYRNFNYLIACSETGETLAIDPLAFPDLPEKPDQRTVFLKLRELRNTW